MQETESGFVVGDGDDAAEFMNFELGHDSGGEGEGEDGQKGAKKGAKKRGALNAQPKRKKDEAAEMVPSHRISQMFLNAKTSKRKTERVEDDAEEEDLNAMLDSILNDPTAVDGTGAVRQKGAAAAAASAAASSSSKDRKRAVRYTRCSAATAATDNTPSVTGHHQHKSAVQSALRGG